MKTLEINTKKNGFNVTCIANVNETDFMLLSKRENWDLNVCKNYLLDAILEKYYTEKTGGMFLFELDIMVLEEVGRNDDNRFYLRFHNELYHITFTNVKIEKSLHNSEALEF